MIVMARWPDREMEKIEIVEIKIQTEIETEMKIEVWLWGFVKFCDFSSCFAIWVYYMISPLNYFVIIKLPVTLHII
jgi:hypothetical protein